MIHGHYYFGRKRVACRNAYCTVCKGSRFAEGLKSLVVLHLWFIPLLPIGTEIRWFCSTCHREIDVRRPSRPFILVAGIFFGIVLTFIGVMIFIEADQKEVGPACLVIGPMMVGGLAYILRTQDYKGFVAATHAVEPLDGDYCPYCKSPVRPTSPPHCQSCHVDIIAK